MTTDSRVAPEKRLSMNIPRCIAASLLVAGMTALADAPTAWYDAIWLSQSKQRGTRGACAGEYEQDNSLVLEDRTNHLITGEYELNMSFFSDRHSSSRCDESDDSVATLDITYKLSGVSSRDAHEVSFDSALKKCVEDGSYHECDSVPRHMRWSLRKVDDHTVTLVGNLVGTNTRTLHLDKK
jgi:hypothetical protein